MERNNKRKRLLRRARLLEIATLGYNFIESGVTVSIGLLTGSSALVSFGLDAAVEGISAGFLFWRLNSEERGVSKEKLRDRKRWSFSVLAIVFSILAGFIIYDSASKLVSQMQSSFSAIALAILILSVVVNPFLAWFKNRTGNQLGAKALVLDSHEQVICLYLTVVVLAGLLLTKFLRWWWADSVAALLIVPYVLWQAWKAFKNARAARKKANNAQS